jgi:hypothetical protein
MGMENGAASPLSVTFVQGLTFALGIGSFDHPDDLDAMVKEALYADQEDVAALFQEIQKVIFEDRAYMKTIAIGPYIGITRPVVHDLRYCEDQWMSADWHLAWKETE